MASPIEVRYTLARQIAAKASALVAKQFRQDLSVELKQDLSPVTLADREAERLLREEIELSFPDDGIVGEEWGVKEGNSPFRWILDPIDGTKSFIQGVPLFGTMVALEQGGRGVVGVITFPALNVSIDAMTGAGAWETRPDGTRVPARVSDVSELKKGVVLTSDWEGFAEKRALENLNHLAANAWYMRTWGDCYGYYLVATGRAVAMVDPRLHIWDAAPLQPILEEAGGTFTDWNGQQRIDSGNGIGSNGKVHDAVLRILGQ